MKKIFKNPIFMFILGLIVATTIGVVASTISSHDITYKNTTVEGAIDDLYSKAKPEYSGNTTVTPTTSEQILSTNNKILKSNITINPIPSTFKELPQTTTVDASKLLSGETAYDNLGNLITGNISTDCVSGYFVHQANTQWNYSFPFVPKYVLLQFDKNDGRSSVFYYQYGVYNNKMLIFNLNNDLSSITVEDGSSFYQNGTLVSPASGAMYREAYNLNYMACK